MRKTLLGCLAGVILGVGASELPEILVNKYLPAWSMQSYGKYEREERLYDDRLEIRERKIQIIPRCPHKQKDPQI